MNWNQALFPSLKRRGGCAIKKMSRSNLSSRRRGGAKRKPDRAQPQEKIGEIFRPEEFRRTDHPVCDASAASRLFINAADRGRDGRDPPLPPNRTGAFRTYGSPEFSLHRRKGGVAAPYNGN